MVSDCKDHEQLGYSNQKEDCSLEHPKGASDLRLQVVQVIKTGPQKLEVLTIKAEKEAKVQKQIKVFLEGIWSQCHLIKHAIIHIINPRYNKEENHYTVDNSNGFLVSEPDSLLTCTHVASSLFCERKTWLNNVFLGQTGTNRAMLVGTLVHEVFQYGVKNRIADQDKLIKFLDEMLEHATVMLETYSVELHINDVRKEAISYVSSIKEWIEKYMFAGPLYPLTNDSNLEVKVVGVSDIEENIWSTKYGLKGKIDVTGSVRIHDRKTKTLADKTIPLELKTGNPNLSSSHAAQVSLYSLMIEDRYAKTDQGFVIYLKDKAAMHNVALTHNIKRDLIQRRNQINSFMRDYYFGPEMLEQSRLCKNCERLTECTLMAELYTPTKLDENRSMKALQTDAIGHLDEKFKIFFQRYHEKLALLLTDNELMTKNGDQRISKGSFWTYSSAEAEERESGFGKLVVSQVDDKARLITFKRHPRHNGSVKSSDFKEPPVITINDDVDNASSPKLTKRKIEDYFTPVKKLRTHPDNDQNRTAESNIPFNTKLDFKRCRMAISLDEDNQNMDSQNSSTAIAIGFINEILKDQLIMKVYEGAVDLLGKPDLMYRIDKLEKRAQLDIERQVLVRLLAREDWRCDRIRQLILDPEYKSTVNLELNLFVLSKGFDSITELAESQQKAVVEAISTDNYYIINEETMQPPSTSETHKLVCVLTKVVNSLGRTILIVAQNVDHLVDLMKLLQQSKIKFILIDDGKSTKARFAYAGNLVKVMENDTFDLGRKFDAYIRQHESAQVVITSYAMSIGGLLFTRRTFGYCIAYDCDTTKLLEALSPMFCSDRHIIIDVRSQEDTPANKKTVECTEKKVRNGDTSLGEHLRSLRFDLHD